MITGFSNKRVKDVIQLNQRAKVRQAQGAFVAEGIKMFLEAPEDMLLQVYLSEELQLDGREDVKDKLHSMKEKGKAFIETVSADVFKKMSDTQTPQGILCVVKMPHYEWEELLRKDGLYLLLENIQDPGNLGTMFRTGEGAGVTAVIMAGSSADLFNPKTIRSTMGSVYRVPFVCTEDIQAAAARLKQAGITVYAAHLKANDRYDAFDYSKGTAFMIGNEANGLTQDAAACSDKYIKIPMEGKLESLNAAISSAILLYEAHKQR